MAKFIKAISISFISILLFLCLIIFINRKQVYPSIQEQKLLNDFFQIKNIKKEKDIVYIQNMVISRIVHENINIGELNTTKTIKLKQGFCYDRSLLLQKFFIMNGFKIRPVYLYYGKSNTSFLDVFKLSTQSHSVFELYFEENWYLIRTNTKMKKLETLTQYLSLHEIVPPHTKYIRYLNNRNGYFLKPSYIPDIYFF